MEHCDRQTKLPAVEGGASIALIVPVKNGGQRWRMVIDSILSQNIQPRRILVIDSGSTDGSAEFAKAAGFEVHCIAPDAFNHGGTRQMAVEMVSDCKTVVFLTQDAILDGRHALEQLVTELHAHPRAGVAYGRQLPRLEAGPIERHARLFNYPEQSIEKSLEDIARLGIKTAFTSNSFSAYRRDILLRAGGFPNNCSMGEDMIAAARILLQGGTVVYEAHARVIHSHGFTIAEEARRYYAIGYMHAQQRALLASFQSPTSEGKRFVRSEIRFLSRHAPRQIPEALIRTLVKFGAYHLGKQTATVFGGRTR
ncbi:glycosyltransferase family A protein [Acidithiobacillus sp. AMEEHan]|uniref:glycosyltransferase family 2 protein n=1 Tax=Acidithiobacillus sp. AMEEHan TaxID=2994951 RepID=UPI0027E43BC3|nr:glycosyltransferase family A protein [Acidithiobacillus sp. AMEEHan]